MDDEDQQDKSLRRGPRKMTRARLGNIARFHVERFATSTGHLRRVLVRRIDRAIRAHGGDRATMVAWVEEVLTELVRAGAIDDGRFALARAAALRHKGRTPMRIRAALLAKGLARDVIEQAIAGSAGPSDEETAYAAGLRYAKRRRLGPFRQPPVDPASRKSQAQKDLAALARAGFSYEIARRVLESAREGDDV